MQDSGHIPIWTGERVERTNAGGRNRYHRAFKEWMVGQALIPGMSTAGLAMRNQVNANQLRRWVVVHGRRAGALPPAMLPVTVLAGVPHPVAQAPAPRALIELEFCQATVRVHAGADAT